MPGLIDMPPELRCMVFVDRRYHPTSFVDASISTLVAWVVWTQRLHMVLLEIRDAAWHGCRVERFRSDAPLLRATSSPHYAFYSPVPYWACVASELRILGGW